MAKARPELKTAWWKKLRQQVLDEAGWRCEIRAVGCAGVASQVDHIRPKAKGGSDHRGNLRAACKPCNQGRHTHYYPTRDWTGRGNDGDV